MSTKARESRVPYERGELIQLLWTPGYQVDLLLAAVVRRPAQEESEGLCDIWRETHLKDNCTSRSILLNRIRVRHPESKTQQDALPGMRPNNKQVSGPCLPAHRTQGPHTHFAS